LKLDLVSIKAEIRPVAMGCAVDNSIDNGFNYGKAPVVVRLKRNQDSSSIEVWDKADGIHQPDKNELYNHFNALMKAAKPKAITTLGVAIVSHVFDQHDGKIHLLKGQSKEYYPSNKNEFPGRIAVIIGIPIRQHKNKSKTH
jgi:two-component system osmolarity sensor histidine kinase EnvZ